MKKSAFSIPEALRFGARATRQHLSFLIMLALVILVLDFVPPLLNQYTMGSWWLRFAADVVFLLVSFAVSLGIVHVTLRLADKKQPSLRDLSNQDLLAPYVIASFVYIVITILGLWIFIIPGIFLGLQYQFAPYLVVDKKLSVFDAFMQSRLMTHGQMWHLLGFATILILINLGGTLLLGIGLAFTLPVTLVAYTHVYRQLLTKGNHHVKKVA